MATDIIARGLAIKALQGGGPSGGVSKSYVDQQIELSEASSRAYVDSRIKVFAMTGAELNTALGNSTLKNGDLVAVIESYTASGMYYKKGNLYSISDGKAINLSDDGIVEYTLDTPDEINQFVSGSNEYYLTPTKKLNLEFNNGKYIGEKVYITFQTVGDTVSTINAAGGNVVPTTIKTSPNCIVELNGKWNGKYWLLHYYENLLSDGDYSEMIVRGN